MHKRYGFTAVELTIAMVVMAILLSIGVVSFRSSLVQARDRERQADVEAIAAHLESLYSQEVKNGSGNVIKQAGSYPYLDCGFDGMGYYSDCSIEDSPYAISSDTRDLIKSAGAQVIKSPLETKHTSIVTPTSSYNSYDRSNFLSNQVPTAAQLGVNKYFYRAQNSKTAACQIGPSNTGWQNGCRSFSLYYVTEADPNTVIRVESRRQ